VLVLAAKVSITAGELATAEVILRRAVARDPAREDAVRLLAQVFDAQDRVAVAVAEFDAVARREPANTTARLIAAVTIHTAGAMAEAQRRYEEVLAADAGALLAAKNLAGIYAAGNVNLIEAERLATTVAARHPHGEIFDTLGSIHLQRHVVRPAIEWFEQAVRLEPRRARFRYHLGVAYARAGAHDRARAAFKEALRLDSGLTAAREALAALGD
jgi:tetratricopeptide (TPR) repeat protein